MLFEYCCNMGSPIETHSRTARYYVFLFMCAVAGLLLSVYLVYEDFAPAGERACDVGSLVSCSKVLDSEYSWLLGVPVAVFGVVSLVLLTNACARARARDTQRARFCHG